MPIDGQQDGAHNSAKSFQQLYEIIQKLRSPDGCPWDREQTLHSLRDALIEETYECVDAISADDTANTREELGDVYLLATMLSYIGEEERLFSVSDVLDEVSEKLVRRHPHVFGDAQVGTSDEVISQWNAIKRDEKRANSETSGPTGSEATSLLESISRALPPLRLGYEYQKKAAKVGFDWPEISPVLDKIREEIDELEEALTARTESTSATEDAPGDGSSEPQDGDHVEEELGDLLFAIVNLARHVRVEPDVALLSSNAKFRRRFAYVERAMKARGIEMNAEQLDLMDEIWNEAKDARL